VPGSARADGRPAGAARTKGRGVGTSESDAGAMLKEERAAALKQFLVTRLVLQGGEEADGPLVSQDVQETHKFAVEAAGCRHNQREKGLVVVTEVVRTACVALRLRHSRVNEHLIGVGVARLTVA
jgi:hypothetical protein